MNKTQASRVHFKRRAEERYGLTLNRFDLREIVKDIQQGKCTFVEKLSNARSKFNVVIKGVEVTVVYDKVRKVAITALPEGAA